MKRMSILFAALILAACSDPNTSPNPTPSAALHVALVSEGSTLLDSAYVDLSAPDLSGSARYIIRGNPLSADIYVPVGNARTFAVTVFAGGYSIGVGSATVNILPINNPPLTMQIRVVAGGAVISATGPITVVISASFTRVHITPKIDTIAVTDTLRFSLVDDTGALFNDPTNFSSVWVFSKTSYVLPTPGVGLIYWSTPNTLCGTIDASGLLRVIQSGCSFKVVGQIGSVADTATVTVK